MAVFGVLTEFSPILKNWFAETEERLKSNNLVKNPFIAKFKRFIVKEEIGSYKKVNPLYLVNMRPIYPNYTYFLWVIVFFVLYFKGFTWFVIIPAALGSLGIFWSKYFYFFMMMFAVRKKGYKGTFKLLRNAECLERVHF